MSRLHPDSSTLPAEMPLVGRSADIEALHRIFGLGPQSESMTILTGETGVGKSRLARGLASEADRRGWTRVFGQAYPVETGVPYALLADTFLPLLRGLDQDALTVLTRGSARELYQLFPALGRAPDVPEVAAEPDEFRMRLYWNFAEFLKRLSDRQPLLVVLEDLHWADISSLSLFHFVARQMGDASVRILGTVNTDYRERGDQLAQGGRSLLSQGSLRLHPIQPLSNEDTETLIKEVFKVSGPPIRQFSSVLYGWTRGNPYFIEETLKALVDSGRLFKRDGTWLGWEASDLALPSSIRDAIETRLASLSPSASGLADLLAVAGTRASLGLVEDLSELGGSEMLDAVDELVHLGVIEENEEAGRVILSFRHPMIRETLYQHLSLVRRRAMHASVAEGLERIHGDRAEERADELAYHFTRAGERAMETRGTRYLAIAGRSALQRHADQEAVDYLEAVVERLTAISEQPPEAASADVDLDAPQPPAELASLKRDLARARARLGQYQEASAIWQGLLDEALARSEKVQAADVHRRLGSIAHWSGAQEVAIDHYDAALELLGDVAPELKAYLELNAGFAFQAMGQAENARPRIEEAFRIAERLDHPELLGRVHWALSLLSTWIGEPDRARTHGWQAVRIGDACGDGAIRFWGRWALAALEGMTGNTEETRELIAQARAVADDLRTPSLGLRVTEISVQLDWAIGEWDRALAEGEQAITLATALSQWNVLPRLLVWTALIYIGRGDLNRGGELVSRAWTLAGLDAEGEGGTDIHTVIPAYIGRAAHTIATGEAAEAVPILEEAFAIADSSGYVFWMLHHVLPLLGESYIRTENVEGAARVGERLRREAERMGHRLGLAWADACDAFVALHSGHAERSSVLLREAAEALERIPIVPEGARVRRQLAGLLADLGDREGSLAELRKVHDVFGRLGAQPELEKARIQFREVGSRPPSRIEAEGTAELTGRETQIATLVADRRSNKSIAKALSISPRTVTTHLANIYRKLDIRTREELGDMVREGRLPVAVINGNAELPAP